MNGASSAMLFLLVFCVAWQRTDAWLSWLNWNKDTSTSTTTMPQTTIKIMMDVACPEYRCEDTNKCLTYTEVCDGRRDCNNGEDEEGCLHDCAADSFVCNSPYLDNRTCIPPSLVCNNVTDCPDGEDESPASCNAKACPLDSFKCADDTKCINPHEVCDTVSNCADGSDEENCSFTEASWPCYEARPCFEYQSGVPHCYAASEACDGVKQCDNGQDELHCVDLSSVNASYTSVTSAVPMAPVDIDAEESTDAETPDTDSFDDEAGDPDVANGDNESSDFPEPEFPDIPIFDKPEADQLATTAAAAAAAAYSHAVESSASQPTASPILVYYDAPSNAYPSNAEGHQPALWHIVAVSASAASLLVIIIIAVVCVKLRYKLKTRNATAIAISGKQTIVTKDDAVHAEATLVKLINRDVQITLPTDNAPLCRGQTVSNKY